KRPQSSYLYVLKATARVAAADGHGLHEDADVTQVDAMAPQVAADADGIVLTGGTADIGSNNHIFTFILVIVAGHIGSDQCIFTAGSKVVAATPTDRSVVAAVCEGLHRSPANRRVFRTSCQGRKSNAAESRVSAKTSGVYSQRRVPDSDVEGGGLVT